MAIAMKRPLAGLLCSIFAAGCGSPDESVSAPSGRQLDEHGVAVTGGETSDFGDQAQRTCMEDERIEIDAAEARSLGLPVDEGLALLAREHTASLHWGAFDCDAGADPSTDSTLTLRADLVELWRVVQRSTTSSVPACDDLLEFRTVVDLDTGDGRAHGRFYARLSLGEYGLCGHALPDLANFTGSLGVEVDVERPHWAVVDAELCLTDGDPTGTLYPAVNYTDGGGGGIPPGSGYGAFWPARLENARCGGAPAAASGPGVVALDDYPGSAEPPTAAVAVRADAVEPMVATDVDVTIDGEVEHHADVPAGSLLELGRFPFGTIVAVDVHNVNGAGAVRAHVLIDDCFAASSQCNEAGCVAHAERAVSGGYCTSD